jgi:general L-amino acid transport system permease protein
MVVAQRGVPRASSIRSSPLLLVVAAGWYLVHNTLLNIRVRGIQSGFDFLKQPAGFAISESLWEFDSAESYAKAYLTACRTRCASRSSASCWRRSPARSSASAGCPGTSSALALHGVRRAVPQRAAAAAAFHLVFRLHRIPAADRRGAAAAAGPLLQQERPAISDSRLGDGPSMVVGASSADRAAWYWAKIARRRFEATGRRRPSFCRAGPHHRHGVPGLARGRRATALDIPEKTEITVTGGGAVTPEFLTVLIGLTLYTASYIAEIVRGGIQAVAFGQHEAAAALGLSRMHEVRLILLPQALRVIIPPITSQYLNLTKNSSLAVAVGYPDLVSISTTTLNQTGRAIEAISLVMLAYLTMSLLTALIMNLYNRRSQIRER